VNSSIDYAIIRYGGDDFSTNRSGAISLFGASPTIQHTIITENQYTGIYASGSQPLIFCNDIYDNDYGIRNITPATVLKAEDVWWGDASGPYHPVDNSSGLGDQVSDGVDFDPWLTQPFTEFCPPGTPGIMVEPTSGLVTSEAGGTDTFIVLLNSQPTANVYIDLSSSDITEGQIDEPSLTFTSENWFTPQPVMVTGMPDDECDGDIPYNIITAPATSSDPNYNGFNADDVSVTNFDDDDCVCPPIVHWKGEYWNNQELSGSPALCRDDFALDFDWWLDPPDPLIQPDNFSARWTRTLFFPTNNYRFHMLHDDGARLYVDDILELDVWETCCVWDIVDVPLIDGNHDIRMEMFETGGVANSSLWWEPLNITGWRGEYYNNTSLSDHPVIVLDIPDINFDWFEGSPHPLIQDDSFSARWIKDIDFPEGDYRFDIFHDDGARLFIDDTLVFENWCDNCRLTESVNVTLSAGVYSIKMEMWENGGWAGAKLTWQIIVPNDDFDDALIITNTPYDNLQDTTGATTAPDDPEFTCVGGQRYNSVWYRYTPTEDGMLTVDTFGSEYDTVLSIWTGERGSLVNIACNDDFNGLQSQVNVDIIAGVTYYIEVAGFNDFSYGWLNLSVVLNPTATLWIEPPEATFPVNTTFTVDIMVAGVTDLYGVELELSFDPALVVVVDADPSKSGIQIQPRDCPSPDFEALNDVNNITGTINYAVTSLSPSPPCNGGGVVASITFQGLAAGISPVHFVHYLLSDTDLNPIPVDPQDGSLTVVPLGILDGTVDLQGREDESGAEVCAWQSGVEMGCTTTDVVGFYSLSLLEGTFDVTVEIGRYLDAEKTDVSVVAGDTTTLTQVKLLGGDCNDDCIINILDLSFMGFRFGSSVGDPNWDERADVNNDEEINILDLTAGGVNFNETCPVPWP
jgi:hypothetical protein